MARLIFMGTPAFAALSLSRLLATGNRPVAVFCQPPRPAGRGHTPRPSPVQELAAAHGLPVHTPTSLKDPAAQETFRALGPDLAVVAAYGMLLPPAVLAIPRLGCVNLHASLLPRWRGAAPIQRAIMAGDPETGVCLMQMEAGLDTGPVLAQCRTPIHDDETGGSLHDRLAELAADLLEAQLPALLAGRLPAIPQPATGSTQATKLSAADEKLDWQQAAGLLERQIRALSPRPGCWFAHQEIRIKVLAAACVAQQGAAGCLLDDAGTIACGEGALRLLQVQRAGRPAMTGAELLRGLRWPVGTMLA